MNAEFTSLFTRLRNEGILQVLDLKASITGEWKHAVDKVFSVNGSVRSLSQVVYPLWVQFE